MQASTTNVLARTREAGMPVANHRGRSRTLSRENQRRSLWATWLGWFFLPIWLAVCWGIYTLVQYLFGVDLTTEMVFGAFKIALASPFVAIGVAWDAAASAF